MDRNRKMKRKTIDYILALCDELKKEIEKEKLGNDIPEEVDKVYMTQTILSVIYKIMLDEGYPRKHLSDYFFFEGEHDKHKEMTEKASKLYHADLEIKSRKKIDGLSDYVNKNREMKRKTIDFIAAFAEKLRKARENKEYDEEYIFLTMLKFAYTIMTKEGYLGEYLDEFFFHDEYPDIEYQTYGEWRKHIAWEDSKKVVEEFFYRNPRGIKLRKEIDKLSEKFNQ
ncbi:hypothetical protein ES705_47939 [subsurface metagenome]